ncbi:MAG: hypothetical protein HYX66_02925 [Ignavibacteria bacterium]|nr:hypothetical protein [Ignavibacteria bacterium]
MRLSTLLKGAVILAALLVLGTDAYAQLPVRTQRLILQGSTSGALTQQTGAVTVDYGVIWPSSSNTDVGAPVLGDNAILFGTYTAGNTWTLTWMKSNGFVDGHGAPNHVTYWDPDGQTLHYSVNFEWNGTRLGVGMDNEANSTDGHPAAGPGNIVIGDGTNAQVQLNAVAGEGSFGNATTAGSVLLNRGNASGTSIDLDGVTATATLGNAANAGSAILTNATGTTNVNLAGATGTATLGSAADDGQLVMNDGGGFTVTVDPGTQLAAQTFTYDNPTVAATTAQAGPFFFTPSTNQAGAGTLDYLYMSNADGTATFSVNPFTGIERGVADPTDAAYTYNVTGLVANPDATDLIMVTVIDGGGIGNIYAVTGFVANGFTVTASGPFTAGERIAWIFIPLPP